MFIVSHDDVFPFEINMKRQRHWELTEWFWQLEHLNILSK
jgi:hypothetical protein